MEPMELLIIAAMKAEHDAIEKYPGRIILLNELLNSNTFHFTESELKLSPEPTFVFVKENNANDENQENGYYDLTRERNNLPCNKKLTKAIKILKIHVKELFYDALNLKEWVLFCAPYIVNDSENNEDYQEGTLSNIGIIEQNCKIFNDKLSTFPKIRGRLVNKYNKYPFIEDYRRLVEEFDYKQHWEITNTLREIRNSYSILYDIFNKIMDKARRTQK